MTSRSSGAVICDSMQYLIDVLPYLPKTSPLSPEDIVVAFKQRARKFVARVVSCVLLLYHLLLPLLPPSLSSAYRLLFPYYTPLQPLRSIYRLLYHHYTP